MTDASDAVPVETGGPADRLLPWPAVKAIAGISRATAWRMQQTGDFPGPVPISPNRVGWWESELTAWKATRLAGGRKRPSPFKPARAPRLIQTARASRPEPVERAAVARDERPPAATAPVRKRRRTPVVAAGQIDFGF